ncbi:ABC transporter permease [Amaricoccus solimangrovi]|uniref:ABC transporter permease n=1 Tax=Amaricoccus solimangrovi TaxID=2589815 RepID=A0A501WRJ4_9RHOB|nr:ABC transporter permease [Amaricoccus solimangrovi]TPE50990.1 ABC transporter permease [Amaricoccus solimangrovi]
MGSILSLPWFDFTVSGVVIGSIYALMAVGLALIFGVANLINFAHGAVFTVGAYVGWVCAVALGLPLWATVPLVALGGGLVGAGIEYIAIRPLNRQSRIAPLLATIGVGLILDQIVHILFGANPRALPVPMPGWRVSVGQGSIGPIDITIFVTAVIAAAALYAFLFRTRLGMAVRATAQDEDAAKQMGVNIHAVNMAVFAIAGALGAIAGLLVGIYYNAIDPNTSFQIMLKGMVAIVIGGMANVPGAIGGGVILGLIESYGIALFGASYRNLFAFAVLLLMLLVKPNGLFAKGREREAEPMTGTFVIQSMPVRPPGWLLALGVAAAALVPLAGQPYLTQVMTNAFLYALAAISLTLIAGTVGLVSIGHAALLAIGAYASALLTIAGLPVALGLVAAAAITALLGTALAYPAFRLRGHYVAIGTLAIGEIVSLVILNWTSLTNGSMGVFGIPPLTLFGVDFFSTNPSYWLVLGLVVVFALLQTRLLSSHLGRTWRAIREDTVAAETYGVGSNYYKGLAYGFAGFTAGLAGAVTAHQFSYINFDTFNLLTSVLILTIVILGGLGNVTGAIVAAVLVAGLPEMFRVLAEYRMLFYGAALLLLIRFRPRGLLGSG